MKPASLSSLLLRTIFALLPACADASLPAFFAVHTTPHGNHARPRARQLVWSAASCHRRQFRASYPHPSLRCTARCCCSGGQRTRAQNHDDGEGDDGIPLSNAGCSPARALGGGVVELPKSWWWYDLSCVVQRGGDHAW
jgi:hypothetical protein